MSQPDLASNAILNHIGTVITAVGALGTASFGIVDATKSMFGGVSTRGFASIAKTMATIIPEKSIQAAVSTNTDEPATSPALSLQSMLVTLKSNWMNGVAHDDQVAIAKSLVKLRLNAALAPSLAQLTGVDAATLASVAAKIASGQPLNAAETDVYGRFDLVLTTLLDQAYERGDQQYRNTAKIVAGVIAILLAVSGNAALGDTSGHGFAAAALVGLLATPLAPIAKDVASAIQAGANAAQSWKS